MTYHPQPIDTSNVTLPDDIIGLTELLARNTHENWSLLRMRDGWIYGNHRDEIKKKHPCLIPYEELPEAEKDYDRQTAMETLKLIIACGYEIKKKSGG